MTETQILAQLKRKYEAEMVSALIGAGFTKNVYGRSLNWSELLADLVEEAYAREMQVMYEQYVHQRFGVEVKSFEEMKEQLVKNIIAKEGYLNVVSRYIEHKGYRESIDYYIETHNPYFYQRSVGLYGVKGDDETELTAKDFTVHQRFLMGSAGYIRGRIDWFLRVASSRSFMEPAAAGVFGVRKSAKRIGLYYTVKPIVNSHSC